MVVGPLIVMFRSEFVVVGPLIVVGPVIGATGIFLLLALVEIVARLVREATKKF